MQKGMLSTINKKLKIVCDDAELVLGAISFHLSSHPSCIIIIVHWVVV